MGSVGIGGRNHSGGRFSSFGLGNSDIILRIQWLEKLGLVVTSWKTQEMQFEVNGRVVKLVGDPMLARSQISFKSHNYEGGGSLWLELNQMEEKEAHG